MLKTRIIPCLLFKGWGIVKSSQFSELRRVGDPTTCARVFNQRQADELIFLDIMATREGKSPNFEVIEEIAEECFMPLTIGGGIRNMEDVDRLFQIGADKICVNTALIDNPEFITQVAKKYGSQAVVASIDAKKIGEDYKVFTKSGSVETQYSPLDLAQRAQALGAGEILLNSINNDGKMEGYDINLIKEVSEHVSVPLIVAGGCGKVEDFVSAVKEGGADAVCAASIFYFIGESIITAKKHMNQAGLNVRII